jgi:hypothetical protein
MLEGHQFDILPGAPVDCHAGVSVAITLNLD